MSIVLKLVGFIILLIIVEALWRTFFGKQKTPSIITSNEDYEDEKISLPDHPIPYGDDEIDLWNGSIDAEFSYAEKGEKKQRYHVELTRIFVRDIHRVHLEGVDHETGEVHQFFFWNIKTMIVAKGYGRIYEHEFLEKLGIDIWQYERDLYEATPKEQAANT